MTTSTSVSETFSRHSFRGGLCPLAAKYSIILGRNPADIKSFHELLKPNGWAREDVRIAALGERVLRVFYCYHPTYGYDRSPSIATLLT